MKSSLVLSIIVLLTVFAGCGKIIDEKSCVSNEDCACGVNINTGECFVGNKAYVNTEKQCPDFCTGIAGNLDTVCSNSKCQTLNTAYCDSDNDCVRKNSCCDCGLGSYVNKNYQVEVDCQGPKCLCPIADSIGKCINNGCTAVPAQKSEFCGTSTSGSCSSSSDCITGGCSSQVCQSKDEKPVVTTCEYKDCYNPEAYDLSCQCIENKCEWGVK